MTIIFRTDPIQWVVTLAIGVVAAAWNTVEFEADILDQLHWLGITWDEGPDAAGGTPRAA